MAASFWSSAFPPTCARYVVKKPAADVVAKLELMRNEIEAGKLAIKSVNDVRATVCSDQLRHS